MARATYSLFDAQMTARLKALCQSNGVTLFVGLLSAFKIILHRYTEQDDILVGTAVANRTRPEFEAVIGFFVNTIVLRTDLSGNPTFTDHLKRVRRVVLESLEHPYVEKLADEINKSIRGRDTI